LPKAFRCGQRDFLSFTKMRLLVAIVLLIASFYGGWQLRDLAAQSKQAQIQAEQASLLAAAQQQARQREQHLQQHMEDLQHETQQKWAEINAIERATADNRVRELATQYAVGSNRLHSPATDGCQTERQHAAVLAELLAELSTPLLTYCIYLLLFFY